MREKIINGITITIMLVMTLVCFVGVVSRFSVSSKLGGSYTRIYPVTSYEIESDGVDVVFTIENDKERERYFDRCYVYLHDGEDTVIVISSDRDGKGLDGVKECYLYLNVDKVAEKIKEKGGS